MTTVLNAIIKFSNTIDMDKAMSDMKDQTTSALGGVETTPGTVGQDNQDSSFSIHITTNRQATEAMHITQSAVMRLGYHSISWKMPGAE
mgnify:CR=1 FL=1